MLTVPLPFAITSNRAFNTGPLNTTVLVLISFIALIVLRYAKTNFNSDADGERFLRWLMTTLLAVIVTVSSNHLVVFWLAWMGISLSMHQLLMFYPNRYRATLAAHKKFILARVAEALLAAAFILLYDVHNSVIISEILARYPASELLWQEQTAALLIAVVALIKCAQLPLHGWLIQVVESPTPVSALLHAGIINLGGFLLLLFAPLFSQSVLAQSLVLVIAGLTTLIAALVMTTRISIKVRLAWSTTAQMGLMLVECALGLYELALLHLLAHSCYKAHAFLTAGNAVNDHILQRLSEQRLPTARAWLMAVVLSAVFLTSAYYWFANSAALSPWVWVGITMSAVMASRFHPGSLRNIATGILAGVAILATYVLMKSGASLLLPTVPQTYQIAADLWIVLISLTLFAVYLGLQYHPSQPRFRRLFIALNAGLYLDEVFTRLTLRLWPIRLPKNTRQTALRTLEAQS